ncbi:MAG: hypothetical protein EXS09_16235 [Gemmataceae bacterium]|nr:hypothetical protein [Gemmataceae bacterium]
MSRLILLLLIPSLACAAPEALSYIDHGKSDPRLKGYRTPEGFKLDIVATVPTLQNPVGMTFGPDGTLFVLEWKADPFAVPVEEIVRYKDGSTRSYFASKKQVKDCVKALVHDTESGAFNSGRVIVEDESPTGILIHGGWLYTSGRGTVRRWMLDKVRDGKSHAAKPEILLRGLHPELSGLSVSPDGWLYVTTGPDADVEGTDGTRVRAKQAAVLRCRPDGSGLSLFADGLRGTSREVIFAARNHLLVVENEKRIAVAEAGSSSDEAQPRSDTIAPFSSATAYHDTQFPEFFRGVLYKSNGKTGLVRGLRSGSAESFSLLASKDPDFRPCQSAIGPDGAIYICDRRGDDSKQGRIYRLSWTGGPVPNEGEHSPAIALRPMDTWAKLLRSGQESGTLESLAKALSNPDTTTALRAQQECFARIRSLKSVLEDAAPWYTDAEHTARTMQGIAGDGEKYRLETRLLCLAALQQLWSDSVRTFFLQMLDEPEADIRRTAVESLARNCKPGDEAASAAIENLLSEANSSVRRAVVLAIGRINAPIAAEVLTIAYKFDDGRDSLLTEGYLRGIERTGKLGLSALVDLAQSGRDGDLANVVAAFLTMRTKPAADLLPRMIAHPHLSGEQRTSLIRSIANYSESPSMTLESIVDYLAKNSKQDSSVFRAASEMVLRVNLSKAPNLGPMLTAALAVDVEEAKIESLHAMRKQGIRSGSSSISRIAEGNGSAALRAEALRTLALVDQNSATMLAEKWIDGDDPALKSIAAEVLCTTAEGAGGVATRFLKRKLPHELLPVVADGLWRHRTIPELAQRRLEVLRLGFRGQSEPGNADGIRQLILKRGDPDRGRRVFLESNCVQCHLIGEVGGTLGPDLTKSWETSSVEALLEEILEPSRSITQGFAKTEVITKDGKTHVGRLLVELKDELQLRTSNGTDVRVPRTEIQHTKKGSTSLMPIDAVSSMRIDQLIDLVAFLKSRQARESMTGYVREYLVMGTSDGNPVDPFSTVDARNIKTTRAGGFLNLRGEPNKANAPLHTFVFVHSARATKVNGYIRVEGAGELRVNGVRLRGLPEGETVIPIPLREGWNVVWFQTTEQEQRHGLSVRMPGEGLRFATTKK